DGQGVREDGGGRDLPGSSMRCRQRALLRRGAGHERSLRNTPEGQATPPRTEQSMSRFLLILCCMAVASSCASTRAPTASELAAYQKPSIARECPTPTSVVPADRCEALPAGYGISRDQPLEWGVYAARGDKQSPL